MVSCPCLRRFLIVFCLLIGVTTASAQGKVVVVVDPAHGGQDPGVRVTEKVLEKDLTLKLALMIQKELQRSGGLSVVLTRGVDEDAAVTERVKKINDLQARVMISLHINAGFFRDAKGFEIYFPGFKAHAPPKDESSAIIGDMTKTKHINESVKLASILQRHLESIFPKEGRGLREAPMPIFEGLSVPAVVMEIGFATNGENRKKLLDEKIQQEIARAIAKSIKESLDL